MTQFNIGDKVKYKPQFLRNTGMYRDFAKERGEIVGIQTLGGKVDSVQLCEIAWKSKDTPRKVIGPNLQKVK